MKGFKGFNSDWTCQNFKFEPGKEYEHDGEVTLCAKGFHFCNASGVRGAANASGKQSCAFAVGYDGRAKGILGSWLTIAEWKEISGEYQRVDVQTKKVDGKKIKADTYYQLKAGKFLAVKA